MGMDSRTPPYHIAKIAAQFRRAWVNIAGHGDTDKTAEQGS